jgi:predicted nucleic acid-binding protein
MIYLLDSNAWIAYLRQKDPVLIQKVRQTNPNDIRLCSIVLGELYYGAFHGAPARQAHNLGLIGQLRQRFLSVPFDDPSTA